MVMATTAATTGGPVVIGFVAAIKAGLRCRNRLSQQRLMLRRAEEPGVWIAASRLPTCDDGAGRLVEPSIDLGAEAEPGQPALHITTLCLVKADLIFGLLSAFSTTAAGSADANCSRSAMLGPALATFALARIAKTDNVRMKTRNGLSSLISESLNDFALRTCVGSNTPP